MIDFGPSRRDDLSQNRLPGAIRFESLSEAACAVQLEWYSKNWQCLPGITYQVPLGSQERKADFRFENTLIEYHPIVLKHEFKGDGHRTFIRGYYQAPQKAREFLRAGLEEHFKAAYYAKRAMIIDLSPDVNIRRCDLVCVHSPLEFAARVLITRLGVKDTPERLAAEFMSIVKAAKRATR